MWHTAHATSGWNAMSPTAAFGRWVHKTYYNCKNIQDYHQVCKFCSHKSTNFCTTKNNALTSKVSQNWKKYTNNHDFAQNRKLKSKSFAGFICTCIYNRHSGSVIPKDFHMSCLKSTQLTGKGWSEKKTIFKYRIRPNYRTVCLDFSKLLNKHLVKYQLNKGTFF